MLPNFYVNLPALRAGTVGGYALAFVCVGVATVLRHAVDPYVVGVPFATFWPAVIITSLISGVGAGLFCIVLSAAAADFFVINPHLLFYIENRADLADLLLFLVLACFSAITITQLHEAIERERAERALRESKERLQLALDTARLGWWQYDPGRLVGSGDARFKEIFDVTADEIPIEEMRNLVHPGESERFWSNHSAMLDPTGPQRSTHEYLVQGRDGEARWVRVCWLAYHEGAGRERRVASVVGTVHDITERKHREERQHLVVRETNHRLKNLISVVDAIAHQTATKNREDFVERFSDRMRRSRPIRTSSCATNGRGSRSRAWFTPSSRILPILSVHASRRTAPSCAWTPMRRSRLDLRSTNLPPMPENTGRSRRTWVV
jgi:PAS domain S-box-containing protein